MKPVVSIIMGSTSDLPVMEKAAEAEWKSERLGGSKPLDKKEVKAMRQNYEKNYSQQTKAETVPTDFPAEETELREHLVTYGNKLTEKRLGQGTWGNLSVRLDSETMLVTPSGIDYALLEAGDMVKVNIHTLKAEGVNKPTSELELHAEIYKAREDAGAGALEICECFCVRVQGHSGSLQGKRRKRAFRSNHPSRCICASGDAYTCSQYRFSTWNRQRGRDGAPRNGSLR